MSRRARWQGRYAALAAAAATVALVAGCGSAVQTTADRVPSPSPALGTPLDQTLPADIATMPLTTSTGAHTTLAAYHGRSVMIADFMTDCEDICPLITSNAVTVGQSLTADGMGPSTAILEISIDPHRDSTSRLAAYRKQYPDVPSNVQLLRASPSDTSRLWSYFHVFIKKVPEDKPADRDWLTGKPLTYDVAHSDDLIFLGPDGHERFLVDAGPDTQGKQPPTRLKDVLSEQGKQLLDHPDPHTTWTAPQAMTVFSWLADRRLASPAV